MSVSVRIPPSMQLIDKWPARLTVEAKTVAEALIAVSTALEGNVERWRLCSPSGIPWRYVYVAVNGGRVEHTHQGERCVLAAAQVLRDGDVVDIIPAMVGSKA